MRKKNITILTVLALAVLFFGSCKKENSYEKLRQDELALLADFVERYETEHNVDLEPTASGLYYVGLEQGTGDTIVSGDRVQIWYKTYLLSDTTLIDTNIDGDFRYNPLEYIVGAGGVIDGLEEATTYMQEGGKAFLIVPSQIAYGQDGSSKVPGFATLLFDVEIYKVYPISEGN